MKRYLVFAGWYFHPLGGWNDYRGSFDNLDAAKDRGRECWADWWHVMDAITEEKVASSEFADELQRRRR